jgi:hypothetical protein
MARRGGYRQRRYVTRGREQLAVAQLQLGEARIEETDVEGVLAFAEHVIGNAAALWTSASATEKRMLQNTLFPDGLAWSAAGFETAVTCRAFSYLREISSVVCEIPSHR